MSDKARDQLQAMFGPSAPSDYQPGDTIAFLCSNEACATGEVLTTIGPDKVGGKPHGVMHMVDTEEGFPRFVSPSRVVQK